MKLSIVTLLLFFLNSVYGQYTFQPSKIRKSILALTKQLPVYNDTLFIEYLQNTYDTIFTKATDIELYELTNHSSPIVRRSSFYTLLDRHSAKVLDLLQKNSGDTIQYFIVQYGHFKEKQTFVDELLFYLSPHSGWDRYFKMTSAQKEFVSMRLKRREIERQEYLLSH